MRVKKTAIRSVRAEKYVSKDEIQARKAAMQRVVEDEKRERETINDKKKAAIEAAQKVFDEAVKAAEEEAHQELNRSNKVKEQKLAAMQRDLNRLSLLRQVYHEAPDDVFELIVSECCDLDESWWGRGGLNAFRLANKRFKQVVESCTNMLTNRQQEDGPESLPIPIIQRCRRIEAIRCESHDLRSLEGCPDGFTKLYIRNAPHLSDFSPLASCSRMEVLTIGDAPHLSDLSQLASCSRMKCLVIANSSITDISVVASMPFLERFACQKRDLGRPSIKDISPLSSSPLLEKVWLGGNHDLKDLSPLSACRALEVLEITLCPLITSLVPLLNLKRLKALSCQHIQPQTSLLPLVSCTDLEELRCDEGAVDLEDLRTRRPDLKVNPPQ